jgi:hypothetical protein
MQLGDFILFEHPADGFVDSFRSTGIISFSYHLINPFQKLRRCLYIGLCHDGTSDSDAAFFKARSKKEGIAAAIPSK